MRRGALLALALALAGTGVSAELPAALVKGGPFALIDHTGQPRTEVHPDGHPQLLFFGYANCPGICSVAMPLMADVVADMARDGVTLTPLMITVDPTRDTVDTMADPLAELHPDFVGLTGTPEALAASYAAFNVEHSLAYEDPQYGPVYSHGSLIYLLDGAGKVLTVLPPILSADRAAEITRSYLTPQG